MTNILLYAPCLYLYAFELADRDQNSEIQIIYQKCEKLLAQFQAPTDLNKNSENATPINATLRFAYDMKPQNNLNRFHHQLAVNNKNYPVWGYACPEKIYDSDCLRFSIRVPERESGSGKLRQVPLEILQAFNQNNQLILNSDYPANDRFLGQTLLLTIGLTDHQRLQAKKENDYLRNIAHDCVNALFADRQIKPPFNRECQLFGCPIFEYGVTSDLSTYNHVLVWFWRNNDAELKFNNCQNELLNLFFYRHRILAAYRQKKAIHELIIKDYQKIKQEIDRFQIVANHQSSSLSPQALAQFHNQLKTLPKLALDYAETLHNLDISQNAIAINTHHYNETVNQIKSLCPNDPESMTFLSRWGEINAPVFEQQIDSDLNYLKSGGTLIEQAISAIRGLVELEQAQGARRLENKLQALAAGVGTAGICAETADYIIVPENPLTIPVMNLPVRPFLSSVTLSIVVGLGTFLVVDRFLNQRV